MLVGTPSALGGSRALGLAEHTHTEKKKGQVQEGCCSHHSCGGLREETWPCKQKQRKNAAESVCMRPLVE